MTTYEQFILSKIPKAESFGFEPISTHHSSLKPHQIDIARWMVRGGRRACFAAFGLGKSRIHLQVAQWVCERDMFKKYLIVAPLGVRQEFTKVEGPAMGLRVEYVRDDSEVKASKAQIVITNYERVRDGNITVTPEVFAGCGLDEAAVLRSFGSKTYQTFLPLFSEIPYRFVFTATPSPNRHKELIHYSGFLGILDTGDCLTRWFKRNSEKAGDLTLYEHSEEEFWMWLASWAVFMQSPADLGYPSEGYDLPPLKVHWHRIEVDHKKAWKQFDSWGQAQLVQDASNGLPELADVKRETMFNRLDFAKTIIEAKPEKHWLLWHDLEAERALIEKALPQFSTVYGTMDLENREEIVLGFSRGEIKNLASKTSLTGSGCNFQRHCADAIFLGANYKFHDFIQAIHRILRFQQTKEVNVHIIFSEAEQAVVDDLKRKWAMHNDLVGKMVELLRKFKLDLKTGDMRRAVGVERKEVCGEWFRIIHNDCVPEIASWPDNSIDEIVTSIPFGTQYEYSSNTCDFGHNEDNNAFFEQMDFLVPHLLRVLRPGRIACIHVKDRIRFGNVTGLGTPTVDRFSDKTADIFERHGFMFMGRITIDTDVVRENNQTYRLGWTENSKDSTKMGVGMPEYVLILRKKPSDLSTAYADNPVTKDKAIYTRSDWQVDAAGLWRSSGVALPDRDAMKQMPLTQLGKIWRQWCAENTYDHETHVDLAKQMESVGRLPATFMLFPPVAKNPDVWTDIARMRVLNSEQGKRQQENHVCPLQIDVVKRLITRYSNPGEIVVDPFGGIGTVPKIAIDLGRKGWAVELSKDYWSCAVHYCQVAQLNRTNPESELFKTEEIATTEEAAA